MKIRCLSLFLLLAFYGIARSEVVLQNKVTTGQTFSNGSSGQFSVTFTAPANGFLTGITLYNSSSSLGATGVTWALSGRTSASINSVKSDGNTISGAQGYFFSFAGTELSGLLASQSYTLSTTNLNSTNGWSITSNTSISQDLGFTGATYDSGSPNYNFELHGVPEPGTWAMMILAAVFSIGAYWWRGLVFAS